MKSINHVLNKKYWFGLQPSNCNGKNEKITLGWKHIMGGSLYARKCIHFWVYFGVYF